MPVVSSRATAVCAALFVTAGLTFGGSGVASADELPLVGSVACDAAVAASGGVVAANSSVTAADAAADDASDDVVAATKVRDDAAAVLLKLVAGDPGFVAAEEAVEDAGADLALAIEAKASADDDLVTAQSNLADAIKQATATLCTTEKPAPEEGSPGNAALFNDLKAQIAALTCGGSFNADQGRISDARFKIDSGLNSEQQGALSDALLAKLNALGFCFDVPTTPTTTVVVPPAPAPATTTRPNVVGGAEVDNNVTVNPLDDDGSVADIDGSQVEVTPEGSISTGAA